jgi:hypothetical protein
MRIARRPARDFRRNAALRSNGPVRRVAHAIVATRSTKQ